MHWLVEPGFLSSGPVRTALVIGTSVAVVSALVGVFAVVRGQSFAGHALTDVAAAGGSIAFLTGLSPVLGFVGMSLAGAGSMEAVGVARVRGRDLATGVVLGAADGLAALFLYFDTTDTATTGATQQVLFGSMFSVDPGETTLLVVCSAVALVALAALYRPLLLASISPDLASVRGVRTRAVGLVFMGAMAVAVGVASVAIGAILSTALLIGPAAAAIRVTRRTGRALALAAAIGAVSTWVGVLVAYDSYSWGTSHNAWPVSFCVVAALFVAYVAVAAVAGVPARRRSGAPGV